LAKAFDHSAVISNLIPKEELVDVNSIDFSLQQNGKQSAGKYQGHDFLLRRSDCIPNLLPSAKGTSFTRVRLLVSVP
jgi:hypothetical protein